MLIVHPCSFVRNAHFNLQGHAKTHFLSTGTAGKDTKYALSLMQLHGCIQMTVDESYTHDALIDSHQL